VTNVTGTPNQQVAESAASAVLLLAHGSLDPRAQESTRALADAVGLSQGCRVETAYLRHVRPRARQALQTLAESGHDRVVVVPLLLTSAFHARVDLPRALTDPPAPVPVVTPVLSGSADVPDQRLITALRRRLGELNVAFDSSTAAGVVGISEPLGDAPEVVELVLERFHDACGTKAGTERA
jgi:sirohydrochlorin ferrochelatase